MDNRELEKKFKVTDGRTYQEVMAMLTGTPFFSNNIKEVVVGHGPDYFWSLGEEDFIRFRPRAQSDGMGFTSHLTVKREDKGDTIDRVEINVPSKSPEKTLAFAKEVWGEPCNVIDKDYTVIWLGENLNVCVYTTDFSDEIILEIEGDCIRQIEKVQVDLFVVGLELEQIHSSLFKMSMEAKK